MRAFVLMSASAYSGKSLNDSGRISWAGEVDEAQCFRYARSDLTQDSVSCSRTCRRVLEDAAWVMAATCGRMSEVPDARTSLRRQQTVFGDKCNGRVHVGRAEDAADQAGHRDGNVVHAHAPLSVRRSIQCRALEVGVDLLVELALVLNPRRDSLVRVDRAKLEVGDVPLEEVAVVLRDPQA